MNFPTDKIRRFGENALSFVAEQIDELSVVILELRAKIAGKSLAVLETQRSVERMDARTFKSEGETTIARILIHFQFYCADDDNIRYLLTESLSDAIRVRKQDELGKSSGDAFMLKLLDLEVIVNRCSIAEKQRIVEVAEDATIEGFIQKIIHELGNRTHTDAKSEMAKDAQDERNELTTK